MPIYIIIKQPNTNDKTLKTGEKGTLCIGDTDQLGKTQPNLEWLDHLYITCELIGHNIETDICLKYDCN